MKRIIWVYQLLMLGLGGCLLKPFTPLPSPAYAVEESWVIVDTDSLTLYARPRVYAGKAGSVASNFFSMFVRVKNKAAKPLTLAGRGFSITADQVQYDPITLAIVLGSLQRDYYPNEDPFAPPQSLETQNQALEQAREQYFELVNSSFSFGDILPGGEKAGYLFYNHRIGARDSFSFDALGTETRFMRR